MSPRKLMFLRVPFSGALLSRAVANSASMSTVRLDGTILAPICGRCVQRGGGRQRLYGERAARWQPRIGTQAFIGKESAGADFDHHVAAEHPDA